MTATKSKPMIFTAESVRAILSGAKTQTRRVMKPQPPSDAVYLAACDDGETWMDSPYARSVTDNMSLRHEFTCPHPVGSHVWVKETWCEGIAGYIHRAGLKLLNEDANGHQTWRRDDDHDRLVDTMCSDWRSPMLMPRAVSRITLEITDVRVQRVQEIRFFDIRAEGVSCQEHDFPGGLCCSECLSLRKEFAARWDIINGKKHPWSSNPWVWAYTFRSVKPA